jgi:hypothetical protein
MPLHRVDGRGRRSPTRRLGCTCGVFREPGGILLGVSHTGRHTRSCGSVVERIAHAVGQNVLSSLRDWDARNRFVQDSHGTGLFLDSAFEAAHCGFSRASYLYLYNLPGRNQFRVLFSSPSHLDCPLLGANKDTGLSLSSASLANRIPSISAAVKA